MSEFSSDVQALVAVVAFLGLLWMLPRLIKNRKEGEDRRYQGGDSSSSGYPGGSGDSEGGNLS